MSSSPENPASLLLIFGLRNPTARYANTRHNAGAMAVQLLAKRHNIEFQQRSNGTVVGRGDLSGTRCAAHPARNIYER